MGKHLNFLYLRVIPLQLTCSKKSILAAGTATNQLPKFKITNTKLYVHFVTLSVSNNIQLLKQLESGFKRAINWNKCHSKNTSSKWIFRYIKWSKFSSSK